MTACPPLFVFTISTFFFSATIGLFLNDETESLLEDDDDEREKEIEEEEDREEEEQKEIEWERCGVRDDGGGERLVKRREDEIRVAIFFLNVVDNQKFLIFMIFIQEIEIKRYM